MQDTLLACRSWRAWEAESMLLQVLFLNTAPCHCVYCFHAIMGCRGGGWVRPFFHCLLCFRLYKNDWRMLLSTPSNCLDFRLFLPVFSKHLFSSLEPTFIALRCNRKEHRLEPVHIRWNARDMNYELCKFG